MKKLLLTLMLVTIVTFGFSQTTYYWVGGATGSMSTTANWNTQLNGSGTSISSSPSANPTSTDVLVFDGTNIGGASPSTGQVIPVINTSFAMGQLKFQNNADVVFMRISTSNPISSGTAVFTINGDNTPAFDLIIDANSTLKITTPLGFTGTTQSIGILIPSNATGQINGTININDAGRAKAYIAVATNANSLFFKTGSKCYVNDSYLYSYPFSGAAASVNNGIIFESGSFLDYQGGNSPFTSNSTIIPMTFNTGSNFIIEFPFTATNVFSKHFLSNVTIRNNSAVIVDSTPYNVDGLTTESGSSLTLPNSGVFPISGDLLNNGTLLTASGSIASTLLFKKTGAQSITGTGTISPIGTLIVGTDSQLSTTENINVSGSSSSLIIGLLNLGNAIINGTGNFQLRSASSVAGTTATITSGSNSITLDATKYSGSINTANVSIGLLITGTGIPANTYIIGSNSSSSIIIISNPATISSPSLSGSVTIAGNAPTLQTSNTGGFDASVMTTGTSKSLGTGSNLIIDAATSAPFPTFSLNDIGSLTLNAAATTNRNATITGTLTLNNAKLTVRPNDNLTMSSISSFVNIGVGSYIVTDVNTGTGAVGVLKVAGLAANKIIPVGSASKYLPITLNPASVSDFSINVFNGATQDATPNGTAISDKTVIVDAIYNINRTSGTGNCDVNLAWDSSLEGSTFTNVADNQIGAAQYVSGAYGSFTGTGNNTANTVALTGVSSFAPFLIGKNAVLPVSLTSFTAQNQSTGVQLKWNTASEQNNSHFDIQRSTDGVTFLNIGKVNGAGNSSSSLDYYFTDKSPASGVNYYRLNQVDLDGQTSLSKVVSANIGFSNSSIQVYASANSANLNISISTEQASSGQLVIYNMGGQKVYEKAISLNKGNNDLSVSLSNTDKGVFIATYNNGSEMLKKKFVK